MSKVTVQSISLGCGGWDEQTRNDGWPLTLLLGHCMGSAERLQGSRHLQPLLGLHLVQPRPQRSRQSATRAGQPQHTTHWRWQKIPTVCHYFLCLILVVWKLDIPVLLSFKKRNKGLIMVTLYNEFVGCGREANISVVAGEKSFMSTIVLYATPRTS